MRLKPSQLHLVNAEDVFRRLAGRLARHGLLTVHDASLGEGRNLDYRDGCIQVRCAADKH